VGVTDLAEGRGKKTPLAAFGGPAKCWLWCRDGGNRKNLGKTMSKEEVLA